MSNIIFQTIHNNTQRIVIHHLYIFPINCDKKFKFTILKIYNFIKLNHSIKIFNIKY